MSPFCAGCGTPVPPAKPGAGKPRKWCSDVCRKRTLYGGASCETCGAPTNANGSAGKHPPRQCSPCFTAAQHDARTWTSETILAEIQRIAAILGRAPSAIEARENTGSLPTTARREFGSWSAALVAAGFPGRESGERIDVDSWYENRYGRSREEMTALIERAAAMYRSGASLALCADTLGLSLNTVASHLRASGVQIRPGGRPKVAA